LGEVARVLVGVSRGFRGGSPGFTPFHVFMALTLLSREPLGRVGLASRLGIGESSARTLIGRLEELGFVRRTRAGVELTEAGLRFLEALGSAIAIYSVNLEELGWSSASLVVVRGFNPPVDLVGVYRVRDYIVAEGCTEAIVGGYTGGALVYPGMPEEILRIVASKLPEEATISDSLHIIVPSGRVAEAFNGVIRMLAELPR